MAVALAALGEAARVRRVCVGIEQPAVGAVLGDAFPLQVVEVGGERAPGRRPAAPPSP
ncbi:hypothetical protein [Phenylobacterium sp. J367]|uniref:hypothetical protein n=1 Tax=Phenylobacterium sp. J367 TaxID=2898435 RepID=UPI0021513882|nr:hypothetical protein [Phenylobacterium sp. J367]MCR5880191.1 hypothetical protein [Phenylobacterium sp. J367]